MSQLVKRSVAKLKDLSSIPRTDMLYGENPYKLPLISTFMETHIHTINVKKRTKICVLNQETVLTQDALVSKGTCSASLVT